MTSQIAANRPPSTLALAPQQTPPWYPPPAPVPHPPPPLPHPPTPLPHQPAPLPQQPAPQLTVDWSCPPAACPPPGLSVNGLDIAAGIAAMRAASGLGVMSGTSGSGAGTDQGGSSFQVSGGSSSKPRALQMPPTRPASRGRSANRATDGDTSPRSRDVSATSLTSQGVGDFLSDGHTSERGESQLMQALWRKVTLQTEMIEYLKTSAAAREEEVIGRHTELVTEVKNTSPIISQFIRDELNSLGADKVDEEVVHGETFILTCVLIYIYICNYVWRVKLCVIM